MVQSFFTMMRIAIVALLCGTGVLSQTIDSNCLLQSIDETFDFCVTLDLPQFEIYWTMNEAAETVSVTFTVPDNGWASLGFSSDTGSSPFAMRGSNAVFGCADFVGNDTAGVDYLVETYAQRSIIPNGNQGLLSYEQVIVNGRCIVSFERPIAPTGVDALQHTGNRLQRVVIASGRENFNYHENLRAFFDVNFVTGSVSAAVTGAAVTPARAAHAVLMALAFGLFFPFGILSAHHKGPIYNGKADSKGLHIWFHVHRVVMPLGALMATISWILILVAEQGAIATAGTVYVHLIVGCFAMVLIFIQLSFVLFRPQGGATVSPARAKWNLAHWWIGRLAWLLAFTNCIIGFVILEPPIGYFVFFLVVVGVFAIVYVYLEIMTRTRGKTERGKQLQSDDVPMQKEQPESGDASKQNGNGVQMAESADVSIREDEPLEKSEDRVEDDELIDDGPV